MTPDTIKFDWISFTVPKNHDETTLPGVLQELFGLDFEDFREIKKKRNYYRRSFLLSGPNGDKLVEIFTDPDTEHNRNTTLFQVSGYALSAYAGNPLQIDVPDLFRRVLAVRGKPTVLHIAMDDTAGRLPWETITWMVDRDRYKDHIVSTSRRKPNDLNRETIYFGERRDRNMVTIYRKDRLEGTKFPWVRVEYRTKDRDTARAIAEKVAAGEDLGPLAAGLIRRHLTFKEVSHLTKYNKPDCQWWVDFLGGVEKMIISRDLAPKRKPVKERKPRSMATIMKDLDPALLNPSEADLQQFISYLEQKGIIAIAQFGTPQEPQTVASSEHRESPEEMPPPIMQDFVPEVWF